MSHIVKIDYTYIAHVQKACGTTLELAGDHQAGTFQDVYDWLQKRAHDLGGFLVSQSIQPSVGAGTTSFIKPQAPKKLPAPKVTVPSVFLDTDVFGVSTRYKGASLCTYKVTKE